MRRDAVRIDPEATSVPLDIDSANETEKSEPSVKHPVSPLALPGEMFCTTAPTISVTSDMFAPDNLRIPQNFVEQAGTESIHRGISVRKPGKHEFIRVRPGNEYQLPVAVIEEVEGMNKTLWLLHPSLLQKLSDEVSYVNLRLAVNLVGIPFLWPLRIS